MHNISIYRSQDCTTTMDIPELADSALQMTKQSHDFFILKDHGFISLGKNLETAGKMTLDYYLKPITLIRDL